MKRVFPILNCDHPGRTIRAVPWELVEPHEAQARRNHDQTLQRLAERGGLDPVELLAVLDDRPIPWPYTVTDIFKAEKVIVQRMGHAQCHPQEPKA